MSITDRSDSGGGNQRPDALDGANALAVWVALECKTTLAREARVNINTVVKKLPSGEWAFPEVNERFEWHKRKHLGKREASDRGEKKIATVLNEVEELREQNRQLTLEVNRLGRLILTERDRADRMVVYEKQNISLREEISRKHRRDGRKEASTKRN